MNKKFLASIFILMILSIFSGRAEANFSNETLHYTITYKWGLIHKDAAKATMRLSNSGDHYNVTLTARTLPWADKFFTVRDTLSSVITKNGLKVKKYVKSTHEGDRYSRDVITFSYGGSSVKGSVQKTRQKKGEAATTSNLTCTASGPTYDMLSIFYYLRTLNFEKMAQNHIYKATIFSGSNSETLSIRLEGIKTITLRNKSKVKAYALKFSFTRDGKKKSSENMTAYISTDSRHIPLYLVGKLPIGEVRVYLDGQ